jgi:hypothetical protein
MGVAQLVRFREQLRATWGNYEQVGATWGNYGQVARSCPDLPQVAHSCPDLLVVARQKAVAAYSVETARAPSGLPEARAA